MISLISIIYPLYQQKPQKFIIAGDPFQIEPIVTIEQWKDENIYKMVGLNQQGSFAKPTTQPHDYLVTMKWHTEFGHLIRGDILTS